MAVGSNINHVTVVCGIIQKQPNDVTHALALSSADQHALDLSQVLRSCSWYISPLAAYACLPAVPIMIAAWLQGLRWQPFSEGCSVRD